MSTTKAWKVVTLENVQRPNSATLPQTYARVPPVVSYQDCQASSSPWSTQGSQLSAPGDLRKNETYPVLTNKNTETFVVHLRQSGKVDVQGPASF